MSDKPTEKRPLRDELRRLAGAPRELWLIYLAKFLESLAYFSMTKMLVLWLSNDFGFSDVAAGWSRSSETMWLIIGLMTLAGPLLLIFLRRTIEGDAKKPVPATAEEVPA